MKQSAFIFSLISFAILFTDIRAQSPIATSSVDHSTPGFADTVTDLMAKMQGDWRIKSATMRGGDLPLDQFESLTVDDKGFTLKMQKRQARFSFAKF